MSVAAPPPVLAEARLTTRRVARTFSLACRLLPRELRDDVYLLYLVFRTLDGSYHAFVEVEAKQAARECGAAELANTREMWKSIWEK